MCMGVNLVGGVDLVIVDNDIEKLLYIIMDIVVEFNVDVDIYLYDVNNFGMFMMKRLVSLIEEVGW